MRVLKITLDKDGEWALGSAGLSLTDLIEVVALGEKRETVEGTEIRFEIERVAARVGVRAAGRMRRLDGTVLLVVDGRIRGCRRVTGESRSGEDHVTVEDEGRNGDDDG